MQTNNPTTIAATTAGVVITAGRGGSGGCYYSLFDSGSEGSVQ